MTSSPHRERLYLKPEVKLEPLVGGWHAFLQLVAPLQAAHAFTHRYVPLLESFTRSPQIHLTASRDPALYGGAFVDLEPEQLETARGLLQTTRSDLHEVLSLAADYRALQGRLDSVVDGRSLDDLYCDLPASLAGLVEFVYDASHRPRARIRESLLYHAMPALRAAQALYMHAQPDAERKFFLNTPRFAGAGELIVPLPFWDPRWDRLAEARSSPVDVEELAGQLGLDATQTAAFRSFFQAAAPPARGTRLDGEGVRLRYFGHACVLAQTADVTILIDPTFAYTPGEPHAALTLADLPDVIDHLVISHGHQDHLCIEALLQLRSRVKSVLLPPNIPGQLEDASLVLALRELGFADVRALQELETLPLPNDGQLISLPFPGEHCGLDVQSKHCLALRLAGRTFAFLVDSDAVDPVLYDRIAAALGPVDVAFVGMECQGAPLSWLYGVLLQKPISRSGDQTRRGNGSDARKAARVIEAIGAQEVYVYAMGMERWNRHLLGLEYAADSIQIQQSAEFVERCRMLGLAARRLQGCEDLLYDRRQLSVLPLPAQRPAADPVVEPVP